jgi:hypothetical protein
MGLGSMVVVADDEEIIDRLRTRVCVHTLGLAFVTNDDNTVDDGVHDALSVPSRGHARDAVLPAR